MADMIILADDLTGAADSAAAAAGQNLAATVLLHCPQHGEFALPETDIVSIDANTRCVSTGEAARITSDLVRTCFQHGAQTPKSFVFKKIDSTLRGHFAAELASLLRARSAPASGREQRCIVMAPALPAQGRTTVGGRLFVDGRPVHEGNIPALLAEAGLSCALVSATIVRGASMELQQSMLTLSRAADVLLCDAETDDDLRRIAEASMVLRERTVWAGSAGLAAQLPAAAGFISNIRQTQPAQFTSGPTLFVVGSLHSASRRQAAMLSELGVTTFHLQPALLLNSADGSAILAALRSNRDVLVVLDDSERCSENEAMLLTRTLAKMIAPCASRLGSFVATGGGTARAILDDLGIRRLQLADEIEPGVPFSIAAGWTRPLPIITKAGASDPPKHSSAAASNSIPSGVVPRASRLYPENGYAKAHYRHHHGRRCRCRPGNYRQEPGKP